MLRLEVQRVSTRVELLQEKEACLVSTCNPSIGGYSAGFLSFAAKEVNCSRPSHMVWHYSQISLIHAYLSTTLNLLSFKSCWLLHKPHGFVRKARVRGWALLEHAPPFGYVIHSTSNATRRCWKKAHYLVYPAAGRYIAWRFPDKSSAGSTATAVKGGLQQFHLLGYSLRPRISSSMMHDSWMHVSK